MLRTILFFLVYVSVTIICQGQDESLYNNKIGLKSGITAMRVRDRVISNHAYTGRSTPILFEYSYYSPKVKSGITLLLNLSDSARLTTDILDGFSYSGEFGSSVENSIGSLNHSTVKGTYSALDIEILGKYKTSEDERFRIYIGGSYNFWGFQKKFLTLAYTNYISSRFNSLSLSASAEYDLGAKHRITYTAWVPVVSIANRTLLLEYGNPGVNEYRKISSFNQYLSINNKVIYNFHFASRWSLEAAYRFTYYQCKFPRKEQAVVQLFTGGLNFYF